MRKAFDHPKCMQRQILIFKSFRLKYNSSLIWDEHILQFTFSLNESLMPKILALAASTMVCSSSYLNKDILETMFLNAKIGTAKETEGNKAR